MKKFILTVAIAVFGMTSAFSQQGNFTAAINLGIPVGDVEEFTTFQLGADLAYRFGLSEQFELGGLIGYSHFFGDSVDFGGESFDIDDIQFLPIAASGRFLATEAFFIGADLGYAIGLSDGNDGGFYYRPNVGYNFGSVAVIAYYSGVSLDGGSASAISLGVEFGL